MEIYSRDLTEGQRWCVHQQRTHKHHVDEEQSARDLPDGLVVALLKVCIATGIEIKKGDATAP